MSIIEQEIESIARRVCRQEIEAHSQSSPAPNSDQQAQRLQHTIALIKAKEYISIKEAALLFGCSDSHIRNVVHKARKGKTKNPIPYRDLDGLTVFKLSEFEEWSNPKLKLKAVS